MSVPFDPKHLPAFAPTHLVVHYDEVALKGRNRAFFEKRLVSNIRAATRDLGIPPVRRLFGRIAVPLGEHGAWREVATRVSRVFGIAYVFPACAVLPDLDDLETLAASAVAEAPGSYKFAVRCKRAAKELPFTSMDVQSAVGRRVQEVTGWSVSLKAPEMIVRIELMSKSGFLGFGRTAGAGGMPSGVAGRVACLLSGGIDSPVAAYRLLRRGTSATFIHFHSYPHTGLESQEKVKELATQILPPGIETELLLVPFSELQRKIVSQTPPQFRVLLYRRFMLRVAEALGRKVGARALVTGESVGQVASQTLENLHSVDAVATLPVLRPLIGMDKSEIIVEAKRIGTFETSIEPHDDCCSFLMPRNPATSSTPWDLDAAEKRLDVEAEVRALLASVERVRVAGIGTTETVAQKGN